MIGVISQHNIKISWKSSAWHRPRHFCHTGHTDHAIHLEPGIKLTAGWMYNLLDFETKTLKAYIEMNLASDFI